MKGKVAITGGTGFVGHYLINSLLASGYEVVVLTRQLPNPATTAPRKGLSYCVWDPYKKQCDAAPLADVVAVMHLAGAGVADARWTTQRKQEIVDSRVQGTQYLVQLINQHIPQCAVLVGTSAIGLYGADGPQSTPFTEDKPANTDFLGHTCMLWENSYQGLPAHCRLALLRVGIVLGKGKGAWAAFAQPVQMGIMPLLGGGQQIISWIAVDDLVGLYLYAMQEKSMEGVYNAVSPNPVSNKALMQAINKALGGWRIPIFVPSWVLKIMLGEMSVEILKSCRVSAQKVLKANFKFQYPLIADVAAHLLSKK
jgi:uncharacterized protein (TIGR01777 family)